MYRTFGKTNSRVIKQDIETVPFDEIKVSDQVGDFFTEYSLKGAWLWLGPQLLAHLGRYKLPEKIDGKYDGMEFLKINVMGQPREEGIYRILVNTSRSLIMTGSQTSPEALPYCSLVPMYLAAQKKYNKINYSSWDNVEKLVEAKLYEAMNSPRLDKDTTNEELLEIRQAGLKGNNATTAYRLVGVNDSVIKELGAYARTMVCQFWCAHPSNRHEYMILDPWDWDNIPRPLISTEPVVSPEPKSNLRLPKKKVLDESDLPWNS